MTLALTINDNGDGTGGTAVISGSDSVSTNTVYQTLFQYTQGICPTWTVAGSRTGDGTIAISPGTALYFWYVTATVSAAPAVAGPIFQALTNQTQAVHYRCLEAYQSGIQGIGLAGVQSKNIKPAWTYTEWETVCQKPGVMIMPFSSEGQPGLLNGKDDIEYPTLVVMIDTMASYNANMARNLLWRQQIFRFFRHQRLTGVPEIFTTDVETRQIVDLSQWLKNLWWSALLFKPRSREIRGV